MNALVVVDVQNDFLPGGALPVPRGEEVVPIINDLSPKFDRVVATQDWHPPRHVSFAASHPGHRIGETIETDFGPQILWPVHCVRHTHGAELAPGLDRRRLFAIFRKGTEPEIESYSGFFDNGHRRATGLGHWLFEQEIDEVYIAGLATDYCVRYTALDALSLGFRTTVIADACRAIERTPGDSDAALREVRRAGGQILSALDLVFPPRPELLR